MPFNPSPDDVITRLRTLVDERDLTSGEVIEDLESYRDLVILACNRAIEDLRADAGPAIN